MNNLRCELTQMTKVMFRLLNYLIIAYLLFPIIAHSANYKDWIETNGYIEFHFYPPHNEYCVNVGVPFSEAVTARYGLELFAEFRCPKFRRLSVFIHPLALFGDSRPQLSYNYDADPIVIRLKYGAGFEIIRNLEMRVTHSEWVDLGGYKVDKAYWNSFSLRYKW